MNEEQEETKVRRDSQRRVKPLNFAHFVEAATPSEFTPRSKSMSSAFLSEVQQRLVAIHSLLCFSIVRLLEANESNRKLLEPFQQRFVAEFNQLYLSENEVAGEVVYCKTFQPLIKFFSNTNLRSSKHASLKSVSEQKTEATGLAVAMLINAVQHSDSLMSQR